MSNYIQTKGIDELISNCSKALDNSQRNINGDVGWHQHLESKKIGIVANSIAILYYNLLDKECPEVEKALEFIVNSQQEDFGWPYISNLPKTSNVESTCWALRALYLHKEKFEIKIDNGVKWLLSRTNIKSPIDQGWGFLSEEFPRVYHTCLVLRTLNFIKQTDKEEFQSGLLYICGLQNSDGGWGELEGKPSGIFYTSYVVVTLIQCGFSNDREIIVSAIKWLESKIIKEGLEIPPNICCLEFIEETINREKSRTPFFHFTIPHIIQAFILSGNNNSYIVYDGIKYLLATNNEGFWNHPFLEDPTIKPIWAIYDSIVAIDLFKKNYNNWNKIHHFKIWHKKIRAIRNISPIRLWDLLNPKLGRFISISFMFTIIFYSIISLYKFIPVEFIPKERGVKEFSLSVIASISASIIITIIKPIYRFIFNGNK